MMRLIPLPWAGALLLQTAALAWWGSALTSRVEAVETRNKNLESVVERITKIETQNTFILEAVKDLRGEIKALVDAARK